jgi:hypothetical protein
MHLQITLATWCPNATDPYRVQLHKHGYGWIFLQECFGIRDITRIRWTGPQQSQFPHLSCIGVAGIPSRDTNNSPLSSLSHRCRTLAEKDRPRLAC